LNGAAAEVTVLKKLLLIAMATMAAFPLASGCETIEPTNGGISVSPLFVPEPYALSNEPRFAAPDSALLRQGLILAEIARLDTPLRILEAQEMVTHTIEPGRILYLVGGSPETSRIYCTLGKADQRSADRISEVTSCLADLDGDGAFDSVHTVLPKLNLWDPSDMRPGILSPGQPLEAPARYSIDSVSRRPEIVVGIRFVEDRKGRRKLQATVLDEMGFPRRTVDEVVLQQTASPQRVSLLGATVEVIRHRPDGIDYRLIAAFPEGATYFMKPRQ
jgi:hypothetical protein